MQLPGRGLRKYSNYSFYRPAVSTYRNDLVSNLHLRDTTDKITWDEVVNVLGILVESINNLIAWYNDLKDWECLKQMGQHSIDSADST